MKPHKRLLPLIEYGLIDSVELQLMSGKEAMVFVVSSGDRLLCAKVYKEAQERSFRQAADYREGRKTRNSRDARAIAKKSKFGREASELAWRSSEIDNLHRLSAAGVRVPKPVNFLEGVLLMELVADSDGDPAPRLADVSFSEADALRAHAALIRDVVRMLCAGLIHGDLSEHNILLSADGPVIIDVPQAVDAAGNLNAKAIAFRDISNLASFFGKFAPSLLESRYPQEIWSLYERGALQPDTPLTGRFREDSRKADVRSVLREIDDAKAAEAARLARLAAREE